MKEESWVGTRLWSFFAIQSRELGLCFLSKFLRFLLYFAKSPISQSSRELRNITDCSTFSFSSLASPLSRTHRMLERCANPSSLLRHHRHLLEASFKFHFCIIWYVNFYILQNFVFSFPHRRSTQHISEMFNVFTNAQMGWFEFSTHDVRHMEKWRGNFISNVWFISIIVAYTKGKKVSFILKVLEIIKFNVRWMRGTAGRKCAMFKGLQRFNELKVRKIAHFCLLWTDFMVNYPPF